MIDQLLLKLGRKERVLEAERRFLEGAPWRVVSYEPNEAIVREGDKPTESCLVLEGFAFRYKSLPQGTRAIMAFHIPGDFCDLHGFLLKRMEHGIAASGHCRIGRLPHAVLTEVTARFPGLTRALWWDTAMDAAIHREWMVGMGRRKAHQQIAHLLCELLVRLKAVGLASGNSYPMPMTQGDLADAFGLSVVHVNKTLRLLRERGLAAVQAKRVTVLDPAQLMELAGFDPTYLDLGDGASSSS